MTVKFTNNASTTVGTGINASATSLTVASASSFPSLSGADDYCYLTIQGATSTTREVVKATALSGNTFTIVRAQDNTSAGTWSAGDIVELRMTAALLTDVIDAATVEGVKTNFQYTPTAGQTVFSGSDNASNTLIINQAALVSVYMNGVRLVQGTDYSVSSANNTVTLTVGATTADIIDIEVFGNFTGQSGAAVAITGGAISGTSVAATTLSASGTATLNTFVSSNATISGGTINNVNIGGTTAGTVAATTLTANSVAVDNITIDGNEIDVGSGNLTLDVAGDISLDADGGDIRLLDGGTQFGKFTRDGGDFLISSSENDKHMKFAGADGGANITALDLDMENGGIATFSGSVGIGGAPVDSSSFGRALDVSSNTGAGLYLRDAGDSTYGAIGMFNSSLSINAKASAGKIVFYSNNSPKAEIGSDGNMLIGTQTTGAIRLNSETNLNGNLAAQFKNTHSTGSYGIKVMGGHDSSNYSAVFTDKDNNTLMMIRGDGSVLVSNGSASAPTYSFSNDTDTGVFLNSVGYLGLAVAGSKQLELGGGVIFTAANGKIRSDSNGGSLELSGGGATVGGQILLRGGTGDADIVFKSGANTSTPTTRMTVHSNGNVNIGMPSGYNAEGKLHVYNGGSGKSYAADSADQLIVENSGSAMIDIRTPNGNTGGILFSDSDGRGRGVIQYAHGGGDIMYFDTASSTRMQLSHDGLALNQASTTAPVLRLTDSGVANYDFTFPNSSTIQLQCHTSSDKEFKVINTAGGRIDFNVEGYCYSGYGFWFNTDSDTGMYRSDTNEISFRVGGNDYFTIDGDSTGYTHKFNNGTYSWYVGTAGNVFNFYDGAGNQRGYVNSSGFQNGSDVAYKENIVDINRGLAEVLQLKPRKFDIKDSVDMEDSDRVLEGDKDELGFIAQELETAIPELVKGEDGSKTIGYAQLTAVLAKAIQEQQTLIESLTARVAELETN